MGCCNFSLSYSLSTALGSRHSRNNSLNLSLLFLHPRSFFDRGGPPAPWALATRSLIFLYWEAYTCCWLRWGSDESPGMSRNRNSPHNSSAHVRSSPCQALQGQRAQQGAPGRTGTITWTPISPWTNMHKNKHLTNYLNGELETNVNVLTVTFLYEKHRW